MFTSRNQNNTIIPSKRYSQQSGRFAQHEELIKYIHEAWHKVSFTLYGVQVHVHSFNAFH